MLLLFSGESSKSMKVAGHREAPRRIVNAACNNYVTTLTCNKDLSTGVSTRRRITLLIYSNAYEVMSTYFRSRFSPYRTSPVTAKVQGTMSSSNHFLLAPWGHALGCPQHTEDSEGTKDSVSGDRSRDPSTRARMPGLKSIVQIWACGGLDRARLFTCVLRRQP